MRAAAALEALGVPEEELVEARVAGLRAQRLRDRMLAARDLVGFVPGAQLVAPIAEVAAAVPLVVQEAGARVVPSDLAELVLVAQDTTAYGKDLTQDDHRARVEFLLSARGQWTSDDRIELF